MLLVFTTYLIPLPVLTLSTMWPLISRKNFSSPDHHCSKSDSCLPPSPSYFCLTNCPVKLCITLHQIFVCTTHPRSIQYIVSGGKKKSVVHKSRYDKYSLHGEGTKIRKQVSFCNIQCFKTKPFNVCSEELNYNSEMAYSESNSVRVYNFINE